MTEREAIIVGCANFAVLWLFYRHVWRKTLLDRFRQRLFAIRDDMFLAAARGDISFDDRAYGLIRTAINYTLRGSSQVSAFYMVFGRLYARRVLREDPSLSFGLHAKIEQALDDLDEPLKEFYERVYSDMVLQILIYMLATSLSIWVFALFSAVRGVLRAGIVGLGMSFRRLAKVFIDASYELDHCESSREDSVRVTPA